MTYHLYQRTITRNGKKIKAWYYWFYDKTGKQVRKSCGQNGKPCLIKREAESFIENLKQEEETKKNHTLTFNEYCKDFYAPDSRYNRKKLARGYVYQENTLYQKKMYLDKFLFAFGDREVNSITSGDVENWLIDLPLCNSVKNNILTVIRDIQKELISDHLIEHKIDVEHFKRNTTDKGILSLTEIDTLFPEEYGKLIDTWRLRSRDKEGEIYSFATMIYTLLSTGMRSSEIRALQWNQFVRKDAILINAMYDSSNQRVNHLKSGTDTKKRWRVTVLPDRTVKMLEILKLTSENEFVFVHKGQPLKLDYLLHHFQNVLKKHNIDYQGRNITIHSLRFTYNSLMRREISGDDLRLMLGHLTEGMTDYYDKSTALQHLDSLLLNKGNLNSVFN